MKVRYGEREHRSSLVESLATSIYLDEYAFNELVKKYDYYGLDDRCNQIMFIAKDMSRKYVWLFIEITEVEEWKIN